MTMAMTSDDTLENLELEGMPAMPAPEADKPDPEAPHGRTATGRPRRKPGRKPGSSTSKRPTTRAGRAAASTTRKVKSYTAALTGMMQLAAVPLLGTAQVTGNAALLADAAAIGVHAEPIAQAVSDLAVDDPRIAAALDKLTAVGPYGALLTAVSPLLVQIAANHRLVSVDMAQRMGAHDPAALLATLDEAAQDVAQEAA